MTNHDASPAADALDALIAQLLDCGGALSQMIGAMEQFQESDMSSPDAPPILDLAHTFIRDVSTDLTNRHSDHELRVSAGIVEQVTAAICENIFIVPPSEIRRSLGRCRAAGARSRKRRRSGRRRH